MNIPEEFDPIRPFEPEELPEVFERLLANKQFVHVMGYTFPQLSAEAFAQTLRSCRTNLDVQKKLAYPFLCGLIAKYCKEMDMNYAAVDNTKRYTFISNHRDIVLDSAFLDKLLIDSGFTTTCEIAIGDNLLALPWIKDLARVNKSFVVERGLPMRQMLAASKRLADYMHFAINEKNENIWIAQREGRAKDSDDRTQEAILKMMAMGGEGSVTDRLAHLHIVPMTISYEFDPCDYLKAQEFQLKRDVPGWKKSPQDDITSMQTGIMGYKGRIHYHCAPCIDDYLHGLDAGLSKTNLYQAVAQHIDTEIHRNYRLYPCNYIALDMLETSTRYAGRYTADDKAFFENYLAAQLAKIQISGKDEDYLMGRVLSMYANPARNYLAAL